MQPALPRRLVLVLVMAATLSLAVGTGVLQGELEPGIEVRGLRPVSSSLRPLAVRSAVYAGDGSLLAVLHAGEDRATVRLADVSPVLRHAIVDFEDAAFWVHKGVSPRAIGRAAVAGVEGGRVVQGGSTITQQLVRNRVLTPERTLGRKLRELVLAMRLEEELGKEAILEEYLNTVYFGRGAYGVEVAAERYFGTSAAGLDVAAAALLAGMIADPTRYDPFAHPDAAERRRQVVLDRMVAMGHLSRAEARIAADRPLPSVPHFPARPRDHVVGEVTRRLLRDTRLDSTAEQRYDRLFRGGLRIQTTIDSKMQAAAETAVRETVPPSPFAAALVAVDPRNGETRAMVSGSGPDASEFNLVTQGARQAGSLFKVVTLTAALENDHSPNELVDGSSPCRFPLPELDQVWRVDNYEGSRGGIVTLREATVRSLNCAFARLVFAVGPDRVVEMAGRLGVRQALKPVPSVTLGSEAVSPLEMATVFATLAAEGDRHDPILIRRVDATDGVVFAEQPRGVRVVDRWVARTVTSVLEGVITDGTGRGADIGRAAAGKTGTAQEWRDAWFGGYTPDLAAVVWMGSPAGEIPMTDVGGIRVVGGSYPARIWAMFMRSALEGVPPTGFVAPDPRQPLGTRKGASE